MPTSFTSASSASTRAWLEPITPTPTTPRRSGRLASTFAEYAITDPPCPPAPVPIRHSACLAARHQSTFGDPQGDQQPSDARAVSNPQVLLKSNGQNNRNCQSATPVAR